MESIKQEKPDDSYPDSDLIKDERDILPSSFEQNIQDQEESRALFRPMEGMNQEQPDDSYPDSDLIKDEKDILPLSFGAAVKSEPPEPIENLKCGLCPKVFSCREDLTQHILTHCDDAIKTEPSDVDVPDIMQPDGTDAQESGIDQGYNKAFMAMSPMMEHTEIHLHDTHKTISTADSVTTAIDIDPSLVTKYPCTICGKQLNTKNGLRRHLIRHDKKIQCPLCEKCFGCESDRTSHIRSHIDKYPSLGIEYPCTICGKQLSTSDALRRHLICHDKKIQCPLCEKYFVSESARTSHIRSHTGERPYACTTCGKRFKNKSHLTNHMPTHRSVEFTGAGKKAVFTCEMCGKDFTTAETLKRHKHFHDTSEMLNIPLDNAEPVATGMNINPSLVIKYPCTICGKQLYTKNGLRRHLVFHDKKLQCPICGKFFGSESARSIHIRSHTGERPYLCTTCGKSFITKTHLTEHIGSHTGESRHKRKKTLKCPMCDKYFSGNKEKEIHIRKHNGQLPYQCELCSKAFTRNSTLKEHMKTHQNEDKTYECFRCHKILASVRMLRRHMKAVHKDLDLSAVKTEFTEAWNECEFICKICSKDYSCRATLRRHMKHAHSQGKRLNVKTVTKSSI